MSTPATRATGAPGSRTSHHKFRYLGDKRVIPVQSGRKMIGYVDGEAVVDANGKEMPFKMIGELR
jgi:hypothetical protein